MIDLVARVLVAGFILFTLLPIASAAPDKLSAAVIVFICFACIAFLIPRDTQ